MGTRSERYQAYRRKVWRLTNEHHPPRAGYTRQHHVPISRGFGNGPEPRFTAEQIGSEENVSYMTLGDNIAQGTQLDETGERLWKQWSETGWPKPTLND